MKKIKRKRNTIGLKELFTAQLPAAIMSRITPMLSAGAGLLLISLLSLFTSLLRPMAPFCAALAVIMIIYALWQKRTVLVKGYEEHLFKVMDYTYMLPIAIGGAHPAHPTGMLLISPDSDGTESNNIYHVATSGKSRNLPPIDWLVRVYVPKGIAPAEYGDRKYFPIVYGYAIEGDRNVINSSGDEQ